MPESVLLSMQNDLVDYRGSGLSVLEMSHRSAEFAEIAAKTSRDFRTLLSIPENYSVLFMQGGASAQFSLCVQNLDTQNKVAYANTGYWSRKAIASAKTLTNVVEVATCSTDATVKIPHSDHWIEEKKASFLHITDNETIDGIAFDRVPDSPLPIVADMSSSILSKPIDVNQYGMIYAGAQKNIGPAGITLVIIRDDLLKRSESTNLPPVFNYSSMAQAGSMLNTPPTFAWYAAGLVFEWLLGLGGLKAIAERNEQQAMQVYKTIDKHECYLNTVSANNRSRMNIPFRLRDESLTEKFLDEAKTLGFTGLKGHKSVGGLRASLYNAVTDDSVDALVNYLETFARGNS